MRGKWESVVWTKVFGDQAEVVEKVLFAGAGPRQIVFACHVNAVGKIAGTAEAAEQVINAWKTRVQNAAVLENQLAAGRGQRICQVQQRFPVRGLYRQQTVIQVGKHGQAS